jgi:hypothetical protein
MARVEERTTEQVRREIGVERDQLATAVGSLRQEMGIGSKLASHLPLVAAGAFCAGFVLAGGIGATMRLAFRRGREKR